jgi:hypothetical protein
MVLGQLDRDPTLSPLSKWMKKAGYSQSVLHLEFALVLNLRLIADPQSPGGHSVRVLMWFEGWFVFSLA